MKKYNIKVNGKAYEVLVEAVDEVQGKIEVDKAPQKNDQPSSNGGNSIVAPISGKVLELKVSIGSKVNKGDTVCIIEAMKLENEIKSSFTGTIKDIKVSKGTNVQAKDVLFVVE